MTSYFLKPYENTASWVIGPVDNLISLGHRKRNLSRYQFASAKTDWFHRAGSCTQHWF